MFSEQDFVPSHLTEEYQHERDTEEEEENEHTLDECQSVKRIPNNFLERLLKTMVI